MSDKVFNFLIDSGSCTNVTSKILVDKLNLQIVKHPNPYTLEWFNDYGKVKVTKQVLISFSIGRYQDKVLCDMVSMQVINLLLGHPWQYDRHVCYDGQ